MHRISLDNLHRHRKVRIPIAFNYHVFNYQILNYLRLTSGLVAVLIKRNCLLSLYWDLPLYGHQLFAEQCYDTVTTEKGIELGKFALHRYQIICKRVWGNNYYQPNYQFSKYGRSLLI